MPNGLSVNRRISRIDARVCSAESGPVAKIPKPPALETAATSGGVEIHDIPGSTSGTLMFSNRVTRVCIVFCCIVPIGRSRWQITAATRFFREIQTQLVCSVRRRRREEVETFTTDEATAGQKVPNSSQNSGNSEKKLSFHKSKIKLEGAVESSSQKKSLCCARFFVWVVCCFVFAQPAASSILEPATLNRQPASTGSAASSKQGAQAEPARQPGSQGTMSKIPPPPPPPPKVPGPALPIMKRKEPKREVSQLEAAGIISLVVCGAIAMIFVVLQVGHFFIVPPAGSYDHHKFPTAEEL